MFKKMFTVALFSVISSSILFSSDAQHAQNLKKQREKAKNSATGNNTNNLPTEKPVFPPFGVPVRQD